MPIVTLPDGSQKSFDKPISVQEVALSIGKGLANAALAGKVNGKLVDTSFTIEKDVQLSIVTEKDKDGIEIIRHSCAHLLAHAVKSVYPQAQITIGPVIEDGFYYDIAFGRPFTPEDLALFEEKMAQIANEDLSVSRHVISREDAIEKFKEMGEHYKVQIIKDIPEGELLTFYQQGDFIDLCRGPHIPSTGKIKCYKLLKVAGAYWRGDSKNEMLQRIYGTAWSNKKELDAYLFRIEEAEKRDHRKLAKKYDLFHMQEEAPGMVFWHPKGWVVYQQIVQYIRSQLKHHDYHEVNTPQVVDRSLWERSGHWQMFHTNMFTVESDERVYAVKPMNCPCHVQIYNQGIKSYRDLPIRLAEFGSCHRNEPSGALHGIMRTRNFVQDDAHIFCTEDQIQEEVSSFIDLLFKIYSDFGYKDILIKLSTRPDKRVGSDAIWDRAEKGLEDALNAKGIAWEHLPGEGAFYGPKIEFSLKDCMGRIWQCGTMQIDFSMPERLGAEYVAEDGSRQTPVMLHRAILGSLERFIGILIEEHAGNFPTWLAPIQVAILNITQSQAEYAQKICEDLKSQGFRAVTDLRNEKIGFKIREHTVQRVPYLVVVGDKEVAQQTLTIRTRTGEDLGSMTLTEFEDKLKSECNNKS
ncbi:MAG: threonine--tRNA ligase [Proteobacteria bacterium]|nr:threonine--tRNA ligase [Pseudomonadota bacterium]